MEFRRMPIEIESPEQMGYNNVRFNLTESSVTDRSFRELLEEAGDFPVSYGDHMGLPVLRDLIASEYPGIHAEHVMTTIGAASALFIVSGSLLSEGDHCLILNPNYITNIETPRALKCDYEFIDLNFENAYTLDIERLESAIRKDTRLISVTYPHNPTGKCLSEAELNQLVSIAEKHNVYLLVDETYRDMQFGTFPALAASLSAKCISVSSLSKTYGLPGIRSGWLISRDPELMEIFLAAKEQIFVTGSLTDEWFSFYFLRKKGKLLPEIHKHILSNRELVSTWIGSSKYFEWVQPEGGCVCFPRFKKSVEIDTDEFYKRLNQTYKTYVGPGHWFEQDRRHFRIGFGYPLEDELRRGLINLEKAASDCI